MKQRIINYLLRRVVRVIIPDDVLSLDKNGKLRLGSKEITDMERRSLQSEAKALESMRLWSIINETLKQQSYERGWRDSTTIEHLNTGKIMYNVLETQQAIVDRLKQ